MASIHLLAADPMLRSYLIRILHITSLDVLERKLLRGEAFQSVVHIESDGLEELRKLLLSESSGMEWTTVVVHSRSALVRIPLSFKYLQI